MESKKEIVTFVILCLSWQASAQVNCTAPGRFAETTDATCQTYVLCVQDSTGAYLSYNYTCPTTSVFNPNTGQCTAAANYVCPNNTSTANDTSEQPVCSEDGYIPDQNVTDCSSYIECVDLSGNGNFSETPYTCPADTFFNPNSTFCEPDYTCDTSTNNTTAPFNCTTAGRFADTSDTTCQGYFFCVQQTDNATYAQYNYTCPSVSLFNPTTRLCTTNYNCTNSSN